MIRILPGMFVAALLLTGCSGGQNFTDIQAYMDEVDARPKQPIEPLPPFEQVPAFAYQASNKRSPFEPPQVLKPVPKNDGRPVSPNLNRVKQFLEQYPIGQLVMVGTLEQARSTYGLVRDADGGVHRVQVGDYMGTDHGQIQTIDETAIELVEIVPDGTGGWVERARTVALGTGE